MFNWYLLTLKQQKAEYLKLMRQLRHTPLEHSMNNIIKEIDHDIEKIMKLNQIEHF